MIEEVVEVVEDPTKLKPLVVIGEWHQYMDKESGRTYWWNVATKRARFAKPREIMMPGEPRFNRPRVDELLKSLDDNAEDHALMSEERPAGIKPPPLAFMNASAMSMGLGTTDTPNSGLQVPPHQMRRHHMRLERLVRPCVLRSTHTHGGAVDPSSAAP